MEEGLIEAQAMAARLACARMTTLHLTELHDSVDRACDLRGRSQWGRRAAAHAEIFTLLAGVVDDPLLAPLLTEGATCAREAMLSVGRAADGMIASSRRRLLAHLRAGDGEAAALEMENTSGASSTCGAWRGLAARRLRTRQRHDRDDQ